jgi:hypothetical protein
MAATMNERVHENRNENLHGRKKINNSFRADKTPAEKGYEFRGVINGQLTGFMVGTMNPFMTPVEATPVSPWFSVRRGAGGPRARSLMRCWAGAPWLHGRDHKRQMSPHGPVVGRPGESGRQKGKPPVHGVHDATMKGLMMIQSMYFSLHFSQVSSGPESGQIACSWGS